MLTFLLLATFVGSLEILFIILIPSFLTRKDMLHVDVNLVPFHFFRNWGSTSSFSFPEFSSYIQECAQDPHQSSLPISYIWEMGGSIHSLIRQMISSVQLVSHIRLCDPRTTTCHASLSITNSQSLLRLMSTKSVVASNHLILCCPLLLLPSLFPSIRVFSMSQFFASGGQIIGVSASASVLPKNIQD